MVDNELQTIRYFNIDTDLPLTLGLLVDVSISQRDAIDDERTASFAFLDDTLTGPADRDKAFIVQFARQTDLLQDVTSSKPKLQAGLKQLDTPATGERLQRYPGEPRLPTRATPATAPPARAVAEPPCTTPSFSPRRVDEQANGSQGRHYSLRWCGQRQQGDPLSSIEAAQRADTIVYVIYYKGRETFGESSRIVAGKEVEAIRAVAEAAVIPVAEATPVAAAVVREDEPESLPSRPDGKKILQRMADETGGGLFEVSKKQTIADIYKQIGAELRAQYRLGYTPGKETASDGYHRIDLSLTKSSPKAALLQTRDGYYSGDSVGHCLPNRSFPC